MFKSRLKRYAIGAFMAAFVVAMIVVPGRALAETVLDYDPTETINPVADNITRLNVNKLEKGARDRVVGAHLAIYEKETGKLITEWISDGSPHEVARNAQDSRHGALNIDTVYILRELEAPEGYTKAKDVEFVIHSDNFNTSGEILSGGEDGNADSEQIRGSGPEQAFVINLYDESTVNVTEEEKRTRQQQREEEERREIQKTEENKVTTPTTTSGTTQVTSTQTTSSGGGSLTKTSDDTSYVPIIVIAVIGVGVIAFAIYKRRQGQ